MSASERIPVSASVLVWARETSGLDVASAAKRLGVAVPTVQKWEAGEQAPTVKQLRAAAGAYKRPLAVLLLPEPPTDFMPIKDFRRQTDTQQRGFSPQLIAEVKRAQMQREVFLELQELAPGSVERASEPPMIPANATGEQAGKVLRAAVGFGPRVTAFAAAPHENLNKWIKSVEDLGILVIHTHRVGLDEVRGFSISDAPFPVIALNGSDWPRARLFTLLHELCHVALNAGGLCDLHEVQPRKRVATDEIEHFCNQVAASALMPEDLLLSVTSVETATANYQWSLEELSALSSRFGASSEALLLRLVTLGRANWDLYWTRKAELEEGYREARERQRARQQESPSGPSYYVVKARDLGHGYVASVLEAFRARAISSLDAVDYLDIKFNQLPNLERVVQR